MQDQLVLSPDAASCMNTDVICIQSHIDGNLLCLVATDDDGRPFLIPNPNVAWDLIRVVIGRFAKDRWRDGPPEST